MTTAWTKVLPALGAGALVLLCDKESSGAIYGGKGVQPNAPNISLCLVGDAETSRPDRVAEILEWIQDFEQVANIRWDYKGSCPAPVAGGLGSPYAECRRSDLEGDDCFLHDVRLRIPGTSAANANVVGKVPGRGCEQDAYEDGASWGNFPTEPTPIRIACTTSRSVRTVTARGATATTRSMSLGTSWALPMSTSGRMCLMEPMSRIPVPPATRAQYLPAQMRTTCCA
jgi:hypothetical protein